MEINQWMGAFLGRMQDAFGLRLTCVGLQGSYGRGEAADRSDIDVVVVLDWLDRKDLDVYRAAVADLPGRERLCGFVSGREELAHWDRGDLFQFCHDTTVLLGDLDFLRPRLREEDVRRAAHRGACDLYHACCHNYLHARDAGALAGCCKGAFFVLQAKHYLETGVYVRRRAELLPRLSGADRRMLEALSAAEWELRFDGLSGEVLDWASALIRQLDGG